MTPASGTRTVEVGFVVLDTFVAVAGEAPPALVGAVAGGACGTGVWAIGVVVATVSGTTIDDAVAGLAGAGDVTGLTEYTGSGAIEEGGGGGSAFTAHT